MTQRSAYVPLLKLVLLVSGSGLASFALASLFGVNGADGVSLARAFRSPALQVDRTSIDAGKVKPGSVVSVRYAVSNRSNRTIRILGLSLSCGCMKSPVKPPLEVRPKQKISIPVEVTIDGEDTLFLRDLTIYTSEPGQRQIDLAFKAQVIQ